MIRRITLTFAVAILAAVAMCAGAAATARAVSTNDQMRDAIMALRGLIDRQAASDFFIYPSRRAVLAGRLDDATWWPRNPWTGAPLSPGHLRGHYQYKVRGDRRGYRLVGYLEGARMVLTGRMPRQVKLAYDHRGEEGLNLIRQYIEDFAAGHDGLYPLPVDVAADGAVGAYPVRRYWPSNPWDHGMMRQRLDRGSFTYRVADDRLSYTLSLHRVLKHDYILTGSNVTSPWQQLLAGLEDEILRRSGRILTGYVTQWKLENAGVLPTVAEFSPAAPVGLAHADWPRDPIHGSAMQSGVAPGRYTYEPGADGAFTLTIHLHSGDFSAGGAPSASTPGHGSGTPES